MKRKQTCLYASGLCLTAFALWTILVRCVDLRPIGPQGSTVGFATLNGWFHDLTGVHMSIYTLTDWLGLVPIAVAAGFGALGLIQWIKRKSLWRVDRSLFVLGGFYAVVIAVFLLFEVLAINYRPVLIEGQLEASYPSSTTLLVMCVMPTAIMQLGGRIHRRMPRVWMTAVIVAFTAFMVIGRLISGVHWLTDIVGGGLLSAGLVQMYRYICGLCEKKG